MTAPSKDRAGGVALFYTVGYLGLSLPVVGAGIAVQYVMFNVVLLSTSLGRSRPVWTRGSPRVSHGSERRSPERALTYEHANDS